MTRRQRLVQNKNLLLYRIAALDKTIAEIAESGHSASISAGGGSQSYTQNDLATLERLRGRYASRVSAINMALSGYGNDTGIRHVVTTRCGRTWTT